MSKTYLSPPHMQGDEIDWIRRAFDSNWIAPLGEHVDGLEREAAERVGMRSAVALSSGTAGMHLALRLLGVGPGDEVLCPTLTFIASASPVVYQGATPVFLDVDPGSWTLDVDLLAEELAQRRRTGKLPRAVVAVDLYGQACDYDRIAPLCEVYGVPLIEDAAEALGGTYRGRPLGSFGACSVLSFNGNKIITTSGGGMLLSDDVDLVARARHLATQAREPAAHYEHAVIGYNYRMSNLLAALGRGQLRVLDERVAARRRNFERYRELLGDLPGIRFMPIPEYSGANCWLTCILVDAEQFGSDREHVRLALEGHDIEARPLWKPMHLQPVFRDAPARGGAVAAALFRDGLCLPSGSSLSDADLERIAGLVRECR